MKELLKIRAMMKKRQPKFIRADFHKKRLEERWIRPRGLHSKVRDNKRGHATKVKSGFGGPRLVRGTSPEGLKVILVHNLNELQQVKKESEGIILSGTVGLKNKILLLKKAKELGIKTVNLDIDAYLKSNEEKLKKKQEKKKKQKPKKKEEKLEEKLEQKKKDEKLTPEEIEKKEKDKLLTKREI